MKKLFLLAVSIGLLEAATAQHLHVPMGGKMLQVPQVKGSKEQIMQQYRQKFKSPVRDMNWWLCYALDMDSLNGFIAALHANYLFSDSNVLVNFGDGYGGTIEGNPWVHMLGDVLDPLAFVFYEINDVTLTNSDPYYLDSAGIVMAYFRNTDASVVDTLLVYYFDSPVGGTNLPLYYYSDPFFLQNYGYDTIYVPFIKYNKSAHRPNAGTALKTMKVPLYEEDSSSFFYFKLFDMNDLFVAANRKVVMAVAFKPGYSYSPFQNIANQYNYVIFASYEENGPQTYQTYIPQEYNVSSIITTSVRYGIDQYGYNNLFVPSYAFYDSYGFERHLFLYNVSDEMTGINEVEATALADLHLIPNPAQQQTDLYFTLSRPAQVSIQLTDVVGRELMSMTPRTVGKGIQRQQMGVDRLQPGLYWVVLRVEGKATTLPLVVTR
ncbi:MAG: T9SS type A sorting domain-containing protein [Chitinophagales bacterium]|nr:T9SS type A sorting domain-containing protein [Chitinophagales bacterium]MDW8428302.1 T9SS type A sorting domain-containing protein [Chitinophagales bacterium]